MALLDVTIVNVAIPSMQAGLGTTTSTIQWVVSGYALAFGLTLVAGGRLGDVYGRRALMMIGLTGFILGSAASGLAADAELVIAARVLQGMSAGLLTPQSSGLIQQLFSGKERGIAFGYFGTTVGVASAIGPILGGVLIALFGEENGWRYIFGINVPIGLVAMIFIWRWVPGRSADAGRTRAERHIDVVGALLLGAAVFSLLLPVVESEDGPGPWLFLLLAVPVFLGLFLWWERRQQAAGLAPLLDLALLRRTRGFANGVLIGALYFTGFTGVLLVVSVFLQEGLGYTPLQAGLLVTPFALGTAVMSPIAGRLVARLNRRITVIAIAVMMSGLVVLWLVLPDGGRSVPLVHAGVPAAARRVGRRRRHLAQPDPVAERRAAPDGRGRRCGDPDRPADRQRARGGAAGDRVPARSRGTATRWTVSRSPCSTSLAILLVALSAAIWDLSRGN